MRIAKARPSVLRAKCFGNRSCLTVKAILSIGRRQQDGQPVKGREAIAWRVEGVAGRKKVGVPSFLIGVFRKLSPPDAVCGGR